MQSCYNYSRIALEFAFQNVGLSRGLALIWHEWVPISLNSTKFQFQWFADSIPIIPRTRFELDIWLQSSISLDCFFTYSDHHNRKCSKAHKGPVKFLSGLANYHRNREVLQCSDSVDVTKNIPPNITTELKNTKRKLMKTGKATRDAAKIARYRNKFVARDDGVVNFRIVW